MISGDVSCFGDDSCVGDDGGKCGGADCYALAFGIPAILMIVSLIIFIFGTPLYIRNRPPGGNNIFFMFFGCLWVRMTRLCTCQYCMVILFCCRLLQGTSYPAGIVVGQGSLSTMLVQNIL